MHILLGRSRFNSGFKDCPAPPRNTRKQTVVREYDRNLRTALFVETGIFLGDEIRFEG